MDFKQRLHKATERGQRTRDTKAREEAVKALSEEECKRLHSKFRLAVTEHIEHCFGQLADEILGFHFEPVVGSHGWGAAVSRDDVGRGTGGKRDNFYSRLEFVVSPFGKYHVLELVAKGTIRNKEVLNRNHYELLGDADVDSFTERIDLWVLEYVELYAAVD